MISHSTPRRLGPAIWKTLGGTQSDWFLSAPFLRTNKRDTSLAS